MSARGRGGPMPGPVGDGGHRGAVGQVLDPVRRLGDRRAQLLGADLGDADGQVRLADGLALQRSDALGMLGPVEGVVVEVEVDASARGGPGRGGGGNAGRS